MNAAHVHLMVNHLPIWALLTGLILVVLGRLRKSEELQGVGLAFWILAGLASGLAVGSGGRAADVISGLPDISSAALHWHEEAAEAALGVSLCLAVLSAVLLFVRSRLGPAGLWLERAAMVLGVAALLFMIAVAGAGGQIHHPELRGQAQSDQR